MRIQLAFSVMVLAACSGDGKGTDTDLGDTDDTVDTDPVDTDTTAVAEPDLTGLWVGGCAPIEGSTTPEYATTTITELTLNLVDTDGVVSGTWDSVASQYTTTTTYVNTTSETYPLDGTRVGADVSLTLDNGTATYGYPSTLVGTVDGDALTLALAIETAYYTLTADCVLDR